MSKLQEMRDQWEKGGEEILCVTHNVDGYKVVYVVLNFRDEFSLHRYFSMRMGLEQEERWQVSVDISNSTLQKCLDEVTEAFEELLPA